MREYFDKDLDKLNNQLIEMGSLVEKAIKKKKGEITKSELIKLCPDVSITTIERTLVQLQRSDKITKIGGGRYTSYVWNSEVSK